MFSGGSSMGLVGSRQGKYYIFLNKACKNNQCGIKLSTDVSMHLEHEECINFHK